MEFLNTSFYLAICFILFIFLTYRVAKKTILQILDAKIQEIKTQVEEAKNLKKEAEFTLQQTKDEIKGLEQLKSKILETAIAESNDSTHKLEQKMQHELALKKIHITEFIEDKKNKAYKDLYKELNDNAIKMVTEYFTVSENEGLSDIEIAKIIKNKH